MSINNYDLAVTRVPTENRMSMPANVGREAAPLNDTRTLMKKLGHPQAILVANKSFGITCAGAILKELKAIIERGGGARYNFSESSLKHCYITLCRLNIIPGKEKITVVVRGGELQLQDNYLWLCRDVAPKALGMDYIEVEIFSKEEIDYIGNKPAPNNKDDVIPYAKRTMLITPDNAAVFVVKYVKNLSVRKKYSYTKDEIMRRAGVYLVKDGNIQKGKNGPQSMSVWQAGDHQCLEMMKKTALRQNFKYISGPGKEGATVITELDNAIEAPEDTRSYTESKVEEILKTPDVTVN